MFKLNTSTSKYSINDIKSQELRRTKLMLISSVQTENQKFALNETGLSSVRLRSFIVTCFSSYSIFTGSLSVALKQLKISLFGEYSLST